jgi:hypothetical protein
VVEGAVLAQIAGAASGDKVVGGAQHLEIVEVIEHGDALALELPKNGGR